MQHSNIMRNNDAKAIREVRRILKRYDPLTNNTYRDQEKTSIWILVVVGMIGLVTLFMFSGCARAYTQEEAIKAVIGESEGEPQLGKNAVACAIINRGSLKGVYGLTAPRVKNHKYSLKTYEQAKKAVVLSHNAEYCEELIHNARFWEGTAFKRPYWTHNMMVTATIGRQRFYK